MSSLRDIRLTYTEQKHRSDRSNLWLYLVIRRVSFYVTWACLRLGVSANQATFISIALGGLGCVFLTTGGQRNCVIGALLIICWDIFDCVDGNLARVTKSTSKYGRFLDSLTGSMMIALLLISVGVGVFNQPDHVVTSLRELFPAGLQVHVDRSLFLILGAWGSLAAVFYSLVFQSFENTFSQPIFDEDDGDIASSKVLSIVLLIGQNIAGFGLLEPLLLIASLFNCRSLLVVFYAVTNSIAAIFVIAQSVRKAKNIGGI